MIQIFLSLLNGFKVIILRGGHNTFFLVHFTVQKTVMVVIKCIRGRARGG